MRDDHVLNATQEEMFAREFSRIEEERSSSDELSQLQLDSEEHMFLKRLLGSWDLPGLEKRNKDLMDKALRRSPNTLAQVATEWKNFADTFFRNRNRPVPYWPLYIEIQEAVGIYGTSRHHRLRRMFKRKIQEQLKVLFERTSQRFPGWKWAARKNCYFTAAFCNEYRLPSGYYAC